MNYKHIFAAAALVIASCCSINAQSVDPSELRIYINPGHGSWTANDRPCQTIGRDPYDTANTDTCGFFESNTDLWKCFGLFNKLREYGLTFDDSLNPYDGVEPFDLMGPGRDLSNNIVFSRTKNGPYPTVNMGTDEKYDAIYNRSLSEISLEVDENNFDMFISIHSNATTEDNGAVTNYVVYYYRGTDGTPAVEGSDEMAAACWPYSLGNEHMTWSAHDDIDEVNSRGDVTAYGSGSTVNGYYGYLGVLKHGVPGFLVEGYFHTYQPARQRAMNPDVDYQEGFEYAHGIADYFGLTKESTGDIYGIVRDKHEKFTDELYNPNSLSDDVYKPLNGVVVTLKKDDQELDTYTTDQEWNGAFVFTDLEPGDYTLEFSADSYKVIDPVTVTVTAAATAYPKIFLEDVDYVSAEAGSGDYPDEINTPAIVAASEYDMEQEYLDNEISELEGKTLRRSILKGDNLYLLALDENNDATILVYDTKNKEVLANVSTEGMTGDYLNVSDIQLTADTVLVACPKSLVEDYDTYGESAATMNIYKWENDEEGLPTGDPVVWFVSDAAGWWNHAYCGESMAYFGTSEEGTLVYTAQTNGSSEQVRLGCIPISGGEKGEVTYTKPTIDGTLITNIMLEGDDGGTYQLYPSPLSSNRVILASSTSSIPLCDFELISADATELASAVDESVIPAATPKVGFFMYAGHAYMVAPTIEEGQSAGVKLIDITDGLDNATEVSTTNTAIEAADLENVSTAGTTVVTKNSDGEVTEAYINLYLTRGTTSISKFTTLGVDQPSARAEYAYDLTGTASDGSYTVTFKSTGDAPDANIILLDDNGDEASSINIGAVSEGENSATIDISSLDEGVYTWEVEIISNVVPTANKVFSALAGTRGLVIDRDPESDYFGYAYAADPFTSGAKGIYMFAPDLTQVNADPYFSTDFNSVSGTVAPYRLAINPNSHNVVISDYSDTHAGLWAFDPADPSAITQMFAGDMASTGAYTYNGSVIGGGGTGADFYGSGEDTKLYAFLEDYPTGNNGYYLVGYDLGEAETITAKPSMSSADSHSLFGSGGDANVIVNDKGIWCAQNRTAAQNLSATPAFALFDFSGNTLFNSASVSNLDGCGYGGMALTDDFSKLAIVNASNKIILFDIIWNGDTPKFVKSYEFTFNTSSSKDADKCYQMAFDQAGNLFVANRYGLQVYGLPNENPVAVTPAKAEYAIDTAGVKEILADDAAAQLKVYPNPATSSVNIEAAADIESIGLYNLAGAMLKADARINGSSATLDVSGLASGVYLINVDGKTIKLIKK